MWNLGDKLKHKMTGMVGTVVSRTEYLDDGPSVGVQPHELKDGVNQAAVWENEKRWQLAPEE